MLNPNDEIRGKHLQAFDNQLQSEIQRFNERQAEEKPEKEAHKSHKGMSTLATLIMTRIVSQ